MDNGWVKLYRKSLKNPLFKKPLMWHYFEYCLLKANHKPQKIIWNKQEMIIDRGSFITGRKQAAKETGLSERNVRTALLTLYNLGMVVKSTSKSTTKFTYLTVCNYDEYQQQENQTDHQSDQQATSKRPASDQQVTTNKNVKKTNKNVKKKDIYTDNKIKTFVDTYIKYISETFQNRAPKSARLEQDSYNAIEKLIRIDKFKEKYIFDVLEFAKLDDFWQDKVLSLANIRKKSSKTGLTKFQNIATAYERGSQTTGDPILDSNLQSAAIFLNRHKNGKDDSVWS